MDSRVKSARVESARGMVWSPARPSLRGVGLAVLLGLGGASFGVVSFGAVSTATAEEVALAQLPGARLDADWFRYTDLKSGVAIDIPAHGYRYDVLADGTGLTLTSADGAVSFTASAHPVDNALATPTPDIRRSIVALYDTAVDNASRKHATITYRVRKDRFFVLSGVVDNHTYYERLAISPACPARFSSLRVFHPHSLTRSLDAVVTRMSLSLRATCRGGEG